VKAWHLGVLFVCVIVLAVGTTAGVVLYVTDRADDRLAAELAANRVTQIAACERGNAIRRRITTVSLGLKEFAAAAADTREASAKGSTDPAVVKRDTEAAVRYRAIADAQSAFPETPCLAVVVVQPGRR